MRQDHDHRFGDRLEVDRHETQLLELSVARNSSRATWVGGAALQIDQYRADIPRTLITVTAYRPSLDS